MLIKVTLVGDELETWKDEEGRAALIKRVRQLSTGEDIDQVSIYFGGLGQVLELAPSSHAKLAVRLREMALHDLANLVDPARQSDMVLRQKYADQLHNASIYLGLKKPYGAELDD